MSAHRRMARTVLCGALAALGLLPAPARATFPGHNGRIVFTSTRDGNAEIYVMNADGSGQTRLTNDPAGDGAPAFSADGTKIVFASSRDVDPFYGYKNAELYVMSAEGSGVTRLTADYNPDLAPTFSPDGTQIAFSRGSIPKHLFLMRTDGSHVSNLTPAPLPGALNYTFTDPSFAPDGSRVAYTNSNKHFAHVAVIAPDGTGDTVFRETSYGHDPSFSPSGATIAFTRGYLYDSLGIAIMNADGSGEAPVAGTTALDSQPAYSPDGRRIAFTSTRDGDADIYTMAADGSDPVRLTTAAGADSEPDWVSGPPPPATPAAATPTASPVRCPSGTSRSVRCSRDGSRRLVMLGSKRSERFVGTNGIERVFGRGGSDVVIARGGDDRISGGSGRDLISGGGGDDMLSGAGGRDRISGGRGDDVLRGGDARDLLIGGPGDDRLSGGRGRDRLLCGAGRDDEAGTGRGDRVGASCERGRRGHGAR